MRRLVLLPAIAMLLAVSPAQSCVQMGTNFWNLGWQGGYGDYCTGSWGNWKPSLLNELKVYSALRFMDWTMVNNLAATSWDQRVQKSAGCTQCSNAYTSIAYEWQIDLVNKVPGCAYWLTVPARADQNYVTKLAQLIYTELAKGRKVYLEYANETWWEPASFDYCNEKGKSLGFSTVLGGINEGVVINGVWGNYNFLGHTYLAAQMWTWFRASWAAAGGDTALVMNVLAGQSGWGGGEECHFMLEAITDPKVNPSGTKADFYAIAPYWISGAEGPLSAEPAVKAHYDWCKAKGIRLCCYEGGPGEADGNATNAQMTRYFEMLNKYIDGPYCQYTHSGGQWGAVNNGYYQSLADWSANHPCNVSTEPVLDATITTDKNAGAFPLAVNFSASLSTGKNLTYTWIFGDGLSGTGATTSHTYQTVGVFEAQLIAFDGTKRDTAKVSIDVTDPTVEPAQRTVNDSTTGTGANRFEFVGSWNVAAGSGAYCGDEHWSTGSGSYYQVRFYGSQIAVYGTKDAHHGIASASIDGGTTTDFDVYSATRAQNALFWTSPALTKGTHILKVNLTGRQNASSAGTVVPVDKVVITQTAGGTALQQPGNGRHNALVTQGNSSAKMTIVNSQGTVVGVCSPAQVSRALGALNGQSAGIYFAVAANGHKGSVRALIHAQKLKE